MFIHGKRKQCCQEGLHRVFYVITLPLAASTFYFSLFWVLSIPNFVDMFCDVRYVVQSCSYTLLTQFVNILSRYVNVMGKCNEYIIWQRVESPHTKQCFHNLNCNIVLHVFRSILSGYIKIQNVVSIIIKYLIKVICMKWYNFWFSKPIIPIICYVHVIIDFLYEHDFFLVQPIPSYLIVLSLAS